MASVYSDNLISDISSEIETIIKNVEISNDLEEIKGYMDELDGIIWQLDEMSSDLDDIITDLPLYLNCVVFSGGEIEKFKIDRKQLYDDYGVNK
jgi:hypothetical protein